MTIDKAITVLQTEARFCKAIDAPERYDALKLGIEALRRLTDIRGDPSLEPSDPLRGETEE